MIWLITCAFGLVAGIVGAAVTWFSVRAELLEYRHRDEMRVLAPLPSEQPYLEDSTSRYDYMAAT
jgi:hypothetical protein